MKRSIYRQLVIDGHDMSSFISLGRNITPDGSEGMCELTLIRRKESDEAVNEIKAAIDQAADKSSIPVQLNWDDWTGRVDIDDTRRVKYVLVPEKVSG